MTEFELKFEIPPRRLPAVKAAMQKLKCNTQRLQARYFDTADGALARKGLVVRVRQEGAHWVQTAKGPTSDPLHRLEHNAALASPASNDLPGVDLARHAGTPVGERLTKALGLKEGEPAPMLILVYATDVQRLTRCVSLEGSDIELALDIGNVVSGQRSAALCELEVELKHGKTAHATELARAWCKRHGLWLSVVSKSMKGQRLGSSNAWGPAESATPPKFKQHASGAHLTVAVLQSCLAQVLSNASEVASGSDQAEHIHQLRVGLRRLRTALRELPLLCDGINPGWAAPLVTAFRHLGEHRDHDLLALGMQHQIMAAGGPALPIAPLESSIPTPAKVVRSPAFQNSLLCVISFVQATASAAATTTHKTPRKILQKRLSTLQSRVVADGNQFLLLDDDHQHDVRKRLKRLRYLTEFAAPLFHSRRVKSFVAGLKPVQDAIGLYNDEIMALQTYRELALTDAQALFGVGWLTARRAPNAEECLRELQAFAKIRPFWA